MHKPQPTDLTQCCPFRAKLTRDQSPFRAGSRLSTSCGEMSQKEATCQKVACPHKGALSIASHNGVRFIGEHSFFSVLLFLGCWALSAAHSLFTLSHFFPLRDSSTALSHVVVHRAVCCRSGCCLRQPPPGFVTAEELRADNRV